MSESKRRCGWRVAGASAISVILAGAPCLAQQAPPATVRVVPANAAPDDSLILGQTFQIEATIPESWDPQSQITVRITTPGGDAKDVVLHRIASANGIATFSTGTYESFGGLRGGTIGLSGLRTDGTIDDLKFGNGEAVRVELTGFRGPDATPSDTIFVFDNEIQQGISRNQDLVQRISDNQLMARKAVEELSAVPNKPPGVEAELAQWRIEMDGKVRWLAGQRAALDKIQTPLAKLVFGNHIVTTLLTDADLRTATPPDLTDRQVVQDSMVAVATGATLASYKLLADITLASAAYKSGQGWIDFWMRTVYDRDTGPAQDEFGRPITTRQQVAASAELAFGLVLVFKFPKIVEWLADGRPLDIRIPGGGRAPGVRAGVDPVPGGPPVRPPLVEPSRPTVRTAPEPGQTKVDPGQTKLDPRQTVIDPNQTVLAPPGAPPNTLGAGGRPPAAPDATLPGNLRRPSVANADDTLLAKPADPGGTSSSPSVQDAAGAAVKAGATRTAVAEIVARSANDAEAIAGLRQLQAAKQAGVFNDAITEALALSGSHGDAVKRLNALAGAARAVNRRYDDILNRNATEAAREARQIAEEAGLSPDEIARLAGRSDLETAANLVRESLVRQGNSVDVSRAELMVVTEIYVRARNGALTPDDIQFLRGQIRDDPGYFDRLPRRWRFNVEEGFAPLLNRRSAGELRDAYRAATEPTSTPTTPGSLDAPSMPAGGNLLNLPESTPLSDDYSDGSPNSVRFALDDALQTAGFDMTGGFRRNAADGTVTYEDGEVKVTGRATGGRLLIDKTVVDATALTTGQQFAAAVPSIEFTIEPGARPAEDEGTGVHVDDLDDPMSMNNPGLINVGLDPSVQMMIAVLDDGGDGVLTVPAAPPPAASSLASIGRRLMGALGALLPGSRGMRATLTSGAPRVVKAPRELWLAPLSSDARQGDAAPKPLQMILTSLGTSTGEAFLVQVVNDGARPVRLTGSLVLEPIAKQAQAAVQQQLQRLSAGGVMTAKLNAYCLEFVRQPPTAGTLFRIAPADLQKRFTPMRNILQASRRLQEAGVLKPDSDPQGYFHAIRQWAIWTKEQKFTLQSFQQAFVEHTRKNFEMAGQTWSKPIEAAVRKVVPHRWAQLGTVIREADRLGAVGAKPNGGEYAQH